MDVPVPRRRVRLPTPSSFPPRFDLRGKGHMAQSPDRETFDPPKVADQNVGKMRTAFEVARHSVTSAMICGPGDRPRSPSLARVQVALDSVRESRIVQNPGCWAWPRIKIEATRAGNDGAVPKSRQACLQLCPNSRAGALDGPELYPFRAANREHTGKLFTLFGRSGLALGHLSEGSMPKACNSRPQAF